MGAMNGRWQSRLRRHLPFVSAAALVLAAGCAPSSAGSTPQIRLVTSRGARSAFIEVTGLSRTQLRMLERASLSADDWQRVLHVSVNSSGTAKTGVAIAGRYALEDGALRFTPLFPFDPGRQYDVKFYAAPGNDSDVPVTATVGLPAPPAAAPTFVTEVYPSGDVIPANQLRLYVHFSAPMGRRGGVEHVKLLDERGREIEEPFLPLDAEFWNADRTRYTVFFDPGRQKRGILPNRTMGPSLVAGRTYTLVVDRRWVDGNGSPLRETYTRRFRAGPPALSAIDWTKWQVVPPSAGTRNPLSMTFPAPLDRGLLLRAIGVERDGQPVAGDVRVDEHETRWTMTPADAWRAGRYEILVLSVLEDLAGNRIGRAFEAESFERTAGAPAEPAVTRIPFTVVP